MKAGQVELVPFVCESPELQRVNHLPKSPKQYCPVTLSLRPMAFSLVLSKFNSRAFSLGDVSLFLKYSFFFMDVSLFCSVLFLLLYFCLCLIYFLTLPNWLLCFIFCSFAVTIQRPHNSRKLTFHYVI